MVAKVPQTLEYKGGQLDTAHVLEDFQDSSDDEEDTRSNEEYLKDLENEYHKRALLAKSRRFFKKGSQRQKPKLRPTKDFEAKYNKVKPELTLLNPGTTTSKLSMFKNKGLVAEAYEWDKKEVSFDDNEMVEVKVLMALANDKNIAVGKKSARNGEWVKISIRKHVNTKIIKENKDLRIKLKELTAITETWLNSSNKVNQSKDTKVSIPAVERPWLSKAKGFILPNHDTSRILLAEAQINITDPLFAIIDSSATEYDSADESSVCNTPLPPLEKLAGAKPVSGPKTIKLILKSNSTFKAEALKGVTINEPPSAPAKAKASASKANSASASKLKNVKN
ncbi:hypothetical protein Tco_0708440 [Tanacetum coccineum]